jgi:hypothetical protein
VSGSHQSVRNYERAMALSAFLIFALGAAAWWYGPRTLDWAVRIAEPVFLGFGALSIILLWAQLRAANAQEREASVRQQEANAREEENSMWKRVLTFHEHFERVPSEPRAQALRQYLLELGITDPPTAYKPIDEIVAAKVMADQGTPTRPTPGKVIVIEYLNDFERFCGAIRAGVVNEKYAHDMRGTRVIDTCYGFSAFITLYRERQEAAAKGQTKFRSQSFCEIRLLGKKWFEKRSLEQAEHERRMIAIEIGVPNMLGQRDSGS